MTHVRFKLPDIGEGVTEGEIVEWFVRAGDAVAEDDPMVEVMTDKATVTIGAPCDARVEELCVQVGAVAKVGQVILILEREVRSEAPSATAVGEISSEVPGAALFGSGAHGSDGTVEERRPEARPLATPATRRLAKEMGVNLRRVQPSGPGGQITPDDVRAAGRGPLEERTPILGVRRKIAERMQRATSTAAHFTFVEECDASRLMEMRARLAPEAERRGVRLNYLPFVIKAVADALGRHPRLNTSIDERTNELVYKKYYNIGVATATDAGLVVPVVHDADRLDLFEVAERVDHLSKRAREGTLEPRELRNSTFTITSLGKQSGLLATPILNHPEVGILGIHRIKERPIVRDGEIVIGRVMLLSLSFDHRVVDGHVGAAFAYDVIETLENPRRPLFEVS